MLIHSQLLLAPANPTTTNRTRSSIASTSIIVTARFLKAFLQLQHLSVFHPKSNEFLEVYLWKTNTMKGKNNLWTLTNYLKRRYNRPVQEVGVLQTLIRSDVYVICKKPVTQERSRSEGGVKLELVTTQTQVVTFYSVFTSFRALQQFAKRYVDRYKSTVWGSLILYSRYQQCWTLNPYGKEFSSVEIKSILYDSPGTLKIKAISYSEADNKLSWTGAFS